MGGVGGLFLLSVSLAMSGRGTDVMSLLREESRIAWDAHETASAASELDLGLEGPMYEAEMAKLTACQPVDNTVIEYIDNFGKVTFGQ